MTIGFRAKHLLVFVLICSICTSTSVHFIDAQKVDNTKNIANDETLTFNDFGLFRQYQDSSYVNSVHTNSSISYNYFNSNVTRDWNNEIYLFLISDFGSCSDYTISFDMSTNFSNASGYLEIALGHYSARNSYTSDFTLKVASSSYSVDGYSSCKVYDADHDYSYNYGDAIYSGDSLSFRLERSSGYLGMLIDEESRGMILNYYYSPNYNQLIHYLLFDFSYQSYSYPTSPNFEFIISNLEISISVSGEPIKRNPFFNNDEILFEIVLPTSLGLVIIITIIALIISQRKRKIRHILDDPTLYDQKEPLSEDFLESLVSPEISEAIAQRVQETVGDKFIPHPMIYDGSADDARCAICRSDVKKGDEIFQCPYCEYIFHKDHFIKWVSTRHKCPICKKELIKQ